jgi:cell division protein FtsW (lipid II flippase)
MPGKIPLAQSDFIFAAITEEFGALFALCLILLCVGNLMLTLNISLRISNDFYRLIALGLGTCYGAQVFIMIGGVIKFIPSTGVTLPLVSYGGSSLVSTMLLFAIIQGLYAIEQDSSDEDEEDEEDE